MQLIAALIKHQHADAWRHIVTRNRHVIQCAGKF